MLLADGRGYVDGLFDVGAPLAHHPPGWVTTLGVVSRLGFRTVRDHQLFTAMLGLVLVVVVALLARQVFGAVTGVVAAFLAALYPGFWVLEAQVLSETLGLIVLGVVTILLYRLRGGVSLPRVAGVAVLTGLAALVRSELFVTAAVVLVVVLVTDPRLTWGKRAVSGLLFLGIVAAMVAPWSIYNSNRFDEPVVLSTNMGSTLLAGNCDFGGPDLGFYQVSCMRQLGIEHPEADRSVLDRLNRAEAIRNVRENLARMPLVVPARIGRTLGIFRPAATVHGVADWQQIRTWPVWLWVVSFWFLLPLAVVGGVVARRRRIWILPLVVPIVVALVIVMIFYGEPRYHSPADASFVVLGAFGLVTLVQHLRPEGPRRERDRCSPRQVDLRETSLPPGGAARAPRPAVRAPARRRMRRRFDRRVRHGPPPRHRGRGRRRPVPSGCPHPGLPLRRCHDAVSGLVVRRRVLRRRAPPHRRPRAPSRRSRPGESGPDDRQGPPHRRDPR